MSRFTISFHTGRTMMIIQRLAIAVAICSLSITAAQAGHIGSNDPATQGFTADGMTENGSGVDDNGTPAWRIDTGPAGQELMYNADLSAQQIADANANGYRLRTNLRIDAANKPLDSDVMGLWAQVGDNWWLVRITTDNDKNPTVHVHNNSDSHAVSGAGYHLYELNVAPGGSSADLFVDGNQVLSGLNSANNPGSKLRFGDGSNSASGAIAYYNQVELAIIPEPATLGLLLLGLAGLIMVRRQKA